MLDFLDISKCIRIHFEISKKNIKLHILILNEKFDRI